jgi:hypothetical protein
MPGQRPHVDRANSALAKQRSNRADLEMLRGEHLKEGTKGH